MEANVPFNKTWNNIAVAMSGGADSTLLAYLICKKIENDNCNHITVHVINNIRCWKTKPWQEYDFQNVYNWFLENFKNLNFVVHTNFVPPELEWGDQGRTIVDEYGKLVSGDTLELRSFAEYVCVTNNVNAYFNGVTRNPRNVDFQGMETRDLESSDENAHLEKMMHMDILACHPFRFIEKNWIIHQYKKLDLMALLDITRSCEGVFPEINYKNYIRGQQVPVCGECFWCKEREWAIDQL